MAQCDKVSFDKHVSKLVINRLMEPLTEHNYNSALLFLGGTVMSFYYTYIAGKYAGFPIVLAIGPTETGKSSAIKAGLEWLKMHFMSKGQIVVLWKGVPCRACHMEMMKLVPTASS